MGSSGSIEIKTLETGIKDTIHDVKLAEQAEKESKLGIRNKLIKHQEVEDIFSVFEPIKTLGEGMSGTVYEVIYKEGNFQKFALKQMKKSNLNSELFMKFKSEIGFLIEMDHPNVIKLYDTYEDGSSFYLCMEECTGGELFDHLTNNKKSKFTEGYAAKVVLQMLYAVNYLHTKTICHRDLKLENFVYLSPEPDSVIKLIDFGLSCRYHKGLKRMRSLVGTPYYMAPEVLKQLEYGLECDVWSLGVITYMLVSGVPPFNGSTQDKIMERAIFGRYEMPDKYFATISEELKDFIGKMLVVDRRMRYTTQQLLTHPWMKAAIDGHGPSNISNEVLMSFKEYGLNTKLMKTALEAIAYNLNIKEIEDLRSQFLLIDQDGNGTITPLEMKIALEKLGLNQEQSDVIFQSIDANNSGLISYSEFMAATIRKKLKLDENILIDAFKRLDVDGNGYLEIEDFKKLLGTTFTESLAKEMIESADTSKDGRVDLNVISIIIESGIYQYDEKLPVKIKSLYFYMYKSYIDYFDNLLI